MDMFINLIIQIISGAIGGNLAGLSKQGMGSGLNTVIGGVGGLVLGQILTAVTGMPAGGAMDVAAVGSNIVGGGVGGLVLTFVIGWIKNKMAAK
ncbi:hypothetical protein [Pseudomonas mucidolens]|uniref:DNA methyltransferase n=1 Tax=Pseudomonas mucidolens TaxID=46679 RepID=A0A1H2LZL5_9PSED|nr:hypothetical protein [Pseudomonas mucidolens]SDU86175.1 hypothetical protein SAMN05216202_0732 [Pseudomonas mucidolens]SQH34956.1 Uncharacterised protein [Pseudomonas mucidolens]